MCWLDEAVFSYTGEDVYPFHLPGAKRRNPGLFGDPFRYDITEIFGFDDLRKPEGLLLELEEAWAESYSAGRAFLSVNGSTGGNLATIFAATEDGSKVIITKGAHWSVYNAASLRHLKVMDLPVETDEAGWTQAVDVDALEKSLSLCTDVQAVVVTSPTYEGMVSDITAIAEIVHRAGAALIVDAAHGAHFGLPGFPFPNPITLGADAVVTSLHKTLPVLGQTSLVMLPRGDDLRIRPERVKHFLNIFQTSSPSYLLLSAAAAGLRFLQQDGEVLADSLWENLWKFYDLTSSLVTIKVRNEDNQDLSKILITTKDNGLTGSELMTILREKYRLELEKCGSYYALALCTMMDLPEGFARLAEALMQIDESGA